MYATTYIGLGSNLNDPRQQISTALQALQQIPDSYLADTSRLYLTTPMGYWAQPDFINAVACLKTQLSPEQLLTQLQSIEHNQGRVRDGQKNQARTLDLDLLLYNNETLALADLIVPHPRMKERAFVLLPLIEIAPYLKIPPGDSVQDLVAALVDWQLKGVRSIGKL